MQIPQNLTASIQRSLDSSRDVLAAFVADSQNAAIIQRMAVALAECFQSGNKALSCGNGGSACDALHFAEEFTGRFKGDRKALPVIPLLDGANLTCIANDYGFEQIFSRGVEAYGKPGDILLAITTSGNSANVIRAIEAARAGGLKVLLFTGKDGGKLHGTCDEEILVKSTDTERIQEVHMVALHILIESVERILFPENYKD
jgi:D-sedoheptulose 7-phosphate isomerase